jgi:hypothetical protein
VIAYEKGGQTPFEKRPAIRFEKKLRVGHRPEGPVVLPSTGRASYTISASTEAVDGT